MGEINSLADMDEDLLKTFIEVYKTRHFGKAADNLHVTQSAVSARIKLLESQLGVSLFVRQRNNIELTPAGKKLIRHAESMIASWNRIRVDIAVEGTDKISVTVGGIPSLWDIYIGRWIRKIHSIEPMVSLTCEALTNDVLQRRLLEGTLDIAFTYDTYLDPGLVMAKTIPVSFVMVSSKPDVSMDEAIASNYIYVDWGTSFARSHSNHFPDIPTPAMRISLGRIARDFIRRSGGSAYLPEKMISLDLKKERLFLVKDAPCIKRDAYVLHRQQNEQSNLIARLIEADI